MEKNTIATVKTRLEQEIHAGNPSWNISQDTATYLTTLLKKTQPRRVLEIGTSTGYSAICMADALSAWGGELITIESHAGRYAEATRNIAETGLPHITQVHGHAPEVLADIPGMFDLCFFDATKYEHLSYFNALKDRVTPGGMIITDNMLSHKAVLAEYKQTVETDPQFKSELVEIGTGLLISTKVS